MPSATTAGRAQRVLVLVGTRPEAIKLASLVEALRDQPGLVTTFVSSGQHPRMVASTLEHLGLAADMELPSVAPGSSLSRECVTLKPSRRMYQRHCAPRPPTNSA